MFTVKNRLNQPLTIGDQTLAAGGSKKVKSLNDDIERLRAKGHVSVSEPAPAKKETPKQDPPKADPPKADPKNNDEEKNKK